LPNHPAEHRAKKIASTTFDNSSQYAYGEEFDERYVRLRIQVNVLSSLNPGTVQVLPDTMTLSVPPDTSLTRLLVLKETAGEEISIIKAYTTSRSIRISKVLRRHGAKYLIAVVVQAGAESETANVYIEHSKGVLQVPVHITAFEVD